ncbi:SDR family NAD(P)-dependent oxidoreductase [Planotetraspora phitsanulokensis]|uniref:Probable oxidoreductase n=1 Tax=Planotetraspora phitsanulokensis TaxID=575192 RepID=A0A8J3U5B1_9ACTN|nr:SDR family NAD(P)-dependent oxidoreductase [Planotetraspora phitsanulokensis]GII38297.1 oxidoreductase [Planotetraspora phitsanulokensis]
MTTDRIITPFTRETTDDQVLEGVDLTGKRVVITGGGSGIGAETARALAAKGADVTIAVRDVETGEKAAADLRRKAGAGDIRVAGLDLLDRGSIDAFGRAWSGPLDVLVNNAGIMALPELHRTKEGWELQFATNHLGHFALALRLHDALAEAGDARIVSVSSNAHRVSPIVFDDIMFERRPYEEWSAYGQSKTANVLFAVEAAKRWAADGITANALMPGGIRTGLQRHQTSAAAQEIFDNYDWKTPEQGASTSVLLAASPLVEGVSGRYFEDNNEAEPTTDLHAETGVRAYALDPVAAERLWNVSLELIGR